MRNSPCKQTQRQLTHTHTHTKTRFFVILYIVFFCLLQSYVGCTIGIWNVGYVMICYGVVDAICSFSFGRLVKYIGHIPFFALGKISLCSS